MKNNEEEMDGVKISRLLHEIEDASLQNILRDIIFMEKNVFDAIKTHRPETIKERK